MIRFKYTGPGQQVVFGVGAFNRLPELIEGLGFRKLMLCSIPRFTSEGSLVPRLTTLLDDFEVMGYYQIQPHVPASQVGKLASIAAEGEVEGLIALGGGSAIGMAKAVSMELERGSAGKAAPSGRTGGRASVPVIAVPTTYSGSEMTPIFGITHQEGERKRKITFSDPVVIPCLTLYDPELTVFMPPEMTASSGINALAHCIEAAYSISRNPLARAAALAGVQRIVSSLERCTIDSSDLKARTEMFCGAYLAAVSLALSQIGLHHGLCHVLGGSAGVPHGIANAIMLSHAVRFNADETAGDLVAVALAMGLQGGSDADLALLTAAAIDDLVGRLSLPRRLRDVGVSRGELPILAATAMKSKAVQNNPKHITHPSQLEAIFQAAW